MPKLYFYDTGLAVGLLGIEEKKQLSTHPLRGSLFENMIIVEFLKKRLNRGKSANLYFWRNNTGNEIDLIISAASGTIPVEIKSGQTITDDLLKGIKFWNKMTQSSGGFLIYGGDITQKRSDGITALPYSDINSMNID